MTHRAICRSDCLARLHGWSFFPPTRLFPLSEQRSMDCSGGTATHPPATKQKRPEFHRIQGNGGLSNDGGRKEGHALPRTGGRTPRRGSPRTLGKGQPTNQSGPAQSPVARPELHAPHRTCHFMFSSTIAEKLNTRLTTTMTTPKAIAIQPMSTPLLAFPR